MIRRIKNQRRECPSDLAPILRAKSYLGGPKLAGRCHHAAFHWCTSPLVSPLDRGPLKQRGLTLLDGVNTPTMCVNPICNLLGNKQPSLLV